MAWEHLPKWAQVPAYFIFLFLFAYLAIRTFGGEHSISGSLCLMGSEQQQDDKICVEPKSGEASISHKARHYGFAQRNFHFALSSSDLIRAIRPGGEISFDLQYSKEVPSASSGLTSNSEETKKTIRQTTMDECRVKLSYFGQTQVEIQQIKHCHPKGFPKNQETAFSDPLSNDRNDFRNWIVSEAHANNNDEIRSLNEISRRLKIHSIDLRESTIISGRAEIYCQLADETIHLSSMDRTLETNNTLSLSPSQWVVYSNDYHFPISTDEYETPDNFTIKLQTKESFFQSTREILAVESKPLNQKFDIYGSRGKVVTVEWVQPYDLLIEQAAGLEANAFDGNIFLVETSDAASSVKSNLAVKIDWNARLPAPVVRDAVARIIAAGHPIEKITAHEKSDTGGAYDMVVRPSAASNEPMNTGKVYSAEQLSLLLDEEDEDKLRIRLDELEDAEPEEISQSDIDFNVGSGSNLYLNDIEISQLDSSESWVAYLASLQDTPRVDLANSVRILEQLCGPTVRDRVIHDRTSQLELLCPEDSTDQASLDNKQLKAQLASLELKFATLKKMQIPETIEYFILFSTDHDHLEKEYREKLKVLAAELNEQNNFTLTIVGHADRTGDFDYNYLLGLRRANAVMDFLVSQKIEPTRIRTISFGEDLPQTTGTSISAMQLNRRVTLLVDTP